ncbi:Cyclic AMP receptor-like protein A [Lachnellula suecica]|uniref:Cyclic AMP receptor-like protein A n=1 Tax=Lachnellula suecica TaxID=602035 RepID=A0A8T9CB89_9HELO|nr:Cyclic AMP receptor-like protein A [Lachnellula suecica]
MSSSEELAPNQLRALVITERVNSCVSLAGILFVLITFMFSSHFNKPINRLIFFASWGNIGSNIASLISEAGPLSSPDIFKPSSLCQFQAFLVQMFLGVDCYWALCMAINVYLVFFKGYTTGRLRRLEVWYLLACYGLSFLPALVFVFINDKNRGHIYGGAIIWCWISPKWDFMRLVFLYAIVWIAILFAFIVYAMAGKVIWSKRRHLDGFLNPLNENPFTNTVTTEIEITHEERFIVKDSGSQDMADLSTEAEGFDPYSVNIEVAPQARQARPAPAALRMRTLTRDVAEAETNADAWLYARVAFLFFLALLVTWVPSSVNRVYALVHPNVVNFPLNYVSSFVFPLQGFWNAISFVEGSYVEWERFSAKGGKYVGQ